MTVSGNRSPGDKPDTPPDDSTGDEINSAAGVIDQIADASRNADGDKIRLGQILDQVGQRSHGPLLLIPSLIALLPTGAIPTVPTIMGVTIILIAVQIIFAGDHVWLPKRLERLSISTARLEGAMTKARPWAKKLDVIIRPRLAFLAQGPAVYAVAALAILLALLMPPLEFIPFAVVMPAFVLVFMSLGLTVGDGLWVLTGFILGAAAIGTGVWLVWGVLF